MNSLKPRIESLEHRVLLDSALGSELAGFDTQAELASSLLERAVQQNQWRFDQPVNHWRCFDWCAFGPDFDLPLAVDAEAGGAGDIEIPSFSDTNTQVAGVDEGDIVETDGEYIYILSQDMVTIVDVRELAHPRVASRFKLEANTYGSDMYLDGDRLMVISNREWFYHGGPFIEPGIAIDVAIDIAPGFWQPPARSSVVATVIDVTDREDPQLVNRTEVDGTLANSRVVDGTGYIVLDEYLRFPEPDIVPVDTAAQEGEKELPEFIYESEESYRTRLATTILDVLPNYLSKDPDGRVQAEGLVADYTSTYTLGDPNSSSILSVFTIDMQADVPTVEDGNSVLTTTGREIFMSRESLYLFQHKWDGPQQTQIIKFDVDAKEVDIEPVASGVVPGRMLDQFSADEYNGDLRIATTVGWGENSSSGVYVLDDEAGALEVKGSVEKLAPTEQIFSARFMGDRAYIVTFRQVDPLFAIDMSDPTNPSVKGELKITGFSEYMQPIDANHLVGIGRDADPRTGRPDALQLSLFDVSDMTDPQLVDRYTFEGGRSTWSAAEHDHHAFRYFAQQETLAVPVSSNENGTWIRDEEGGRLWVPAIYNHALHVIDVDPEEGFSFRGAVEHPSQVQRSVRVGDALYSISMDTFLANELANLDNQLGKIYYLPPANGGVIPTDPKPDDIDRLFVEAASTNNDKEFDIDGNSLVNTDDVAFVVEAVVNSQFGDTDLDGDVDFSDFLKLSANFGNEGQWADGDFNGDGIVNFADFIVLSKNFGL